MPISSEMRALAEKVKELQTVVEAQQDIIQNMQANSSKEIAPSRNPLQALKAPPIPIFTGKICDCTSIKVKGFISNVRRIGNLTRASETQLVELAACHLQEKAATWITRVETSLEKPDNLEKLQVMMLKHFVPANEKTRAVTKLWAFKMISKMDKHINEFIELVELAEASEKEAYNYFFNSLPGRFQKEFIEEFPTGDFKTMEDVYDIARKLAFSEEFLVKDKPRRGNVSQDKPTSINQHKESTNKSNFSVQQTKKDPNVLCWGPAKKGEGKIYRLHDRCCKCGKGPWSDPNHPCRLKADVNNQENPKNE